MKKQDVVYDDVIYASALQCIMGKNQSKWERNSAYHIINKSIMLFIPHLYPLDIKQFLQVIFLQIHIPCTYSGVIYFKSNFL